MTPIENLERKLARVFDQVEEAKSLRILAAAPEWKVLSTRLNRQIVGKINALCALDCDDRVTTILRAEISALRWFLRAPQIKDDDFERMVSEFEDLRQKVALLHTRGHNSADASESASLAENVDRLHREIEAMP